MRRYLFPILLLLAFKAGANSIPATLLAQEKDVVALFKAYTSSNVLENAHDSLSRLFRNGLVELLKNESAQEYAFDSLRNYIGITKSTDGKLRIFSWDERDGGTWHDMTSYAQFRGNDGKLHVEQLDTDNETETGAFTDVRIYSIHQVERNGRTAYLLLGVGTHGGGMHHAEARLLTIGMNGIEWCADAFDGTGELVTEMPRTYPIEMSYDEKKQVLSYNEYKWSDVSAGKSRCLHPIELVLENGRFKKRGS